MQNQNKLFLPHALVPEDEFFFYSRGREMWTVSGEFRDTCEDKFRIQLEQSDLV